MSNTVSSRTAFTRLDGEIWRTDYRDPLSPYATIFCHDSEFLEDVELTKLTHRKRIIEFQIAEGSDPEKLKAVDVQTIRAPS